MRDRRSVEEENYAEAEGQAFAVTQISEVRLVGGFSRGRCGWEELMWLFFRLGVGTGWD